MSQTSDIEYINLKKAALVIAKLLLRTREGRIKWQDALPAYPKDAQLIAQLEDNIEATIIRSSLAITFKLAGRPNTGNALGSANDASNAPIANDILSISLFPSLSSDGRRTPESIVYRDLEEIIQLAKNPELVAEDVQYKQVMSYLDKLAV